MRTTVSSADELLQANEQSAPVEIPVFRGGRGLRPGVDITSNRALHELLDEGLDFEKLR